MPRCGASGNPVPPSVILAKAGIHSPRLSSRRAERRGNLAAPTTPVHPEPVEGHPLSRRERVGVRGVLTPQNPVPPVQQCWIRLPVSLDGRGAGGEGRTHASNPVPPVQQCWIRLPLSLDGRGAGGEGRTHASNPVHPVHPCRIRSRLPSWERGWGEGEPPRILSPPPPFILSLSKDPRLPSWERGRR